MAARVSRSGSAGPASSVRSPRFFEMLVKGQSCHVRANKRSVFTNTFSLRNILSGTPRLCLGGRGQSAISKINGGRLKDRSE